ncbi:hypothetical protein CHS0354_037717 [Potamilus streckersoni]|uniref:Uncharacterized protein n=1 Tax=Potamilus streckersoni TaxID=2493646 RepID=A0AAE0W4P1_9BIVA|nr:hypothetical protein CHS0354_037717 [Potamilus streckersoni]
MKCWIIRDNRESVQKLGNCLDHPRQSRIRQEVRELFGSSQTIANPIRSQRMILPLWCFRGLCVDASSATTTTTDGSITTTDGSATATDGSTTATVAPTTTICTETVTCEWLRRFRYAGNGCCTNVVNTDCCIPTRRNRICVVERNC